MHFFPYYAARGAGLFAEEGIEVDLVLVGTGTRRAASVMGGSGPWCMAPSRGPLESMVRY